MTPPQRRHHAIPLHQAAEESPTLARLSERLRASSGRMQAIRSLLPVALRASVQAGPYENGHWCLLASSSAAAAKLRQLLPALRLHLQAQGLEVSEIRIRVLGPTH